MTRGVRVLHQRAMRAMRVCVPVLLMMVLIGSCGDSTPVTPTVTDVSVSAATQALTVGSTTPLTVQVRDDAGAAVRAPVISWSSSAPSVATVSGRGVVTAIAPGTVRIAASSGGVSGTVQLTVQARPVASLVITPPQAVLIVGQSQTLSAQPLDAERNALSGREVTWQSASNAVATVSANGVVTAVAPGVTNVTATCEGRTATIAVVVSLEPVQTVVVTPTVDTLVVDEQRTLRAEARSGAGQVLAGRTISWSSSAPAVASVSASGDITALAAGTALVSATSEGRQGTATIVVVARRTNSVTVLPSSITLVQGDSLPVQVQVTDAAGNILLGRPVELRSETPSVATVSANGVVRAVSVGSTRIVATSESRTGHADVQVVPVPIATVTLTPPALTLLTDQTRRLTVEARTAAGVLQTGRPVVFTSGAPAIASVDSTGLVTARAPGTAVLFAAVGGVIGTSTVVVAPRTAATAEILFSTLSVDVGGSLQLSAVVRDATGQRLDNVPVTWTSSDERLAVVSSSGLVAGFRPGSVVITLRVEQVSASVTIVVR